MAHKKTEPRAIGPGKVLRVSAEEIARLWGISERRVRKLQGELGDLKDEYGPRRKELLKKVREIFEAGVEALKAGKKPAEKKPKKTERKDESTKQKPKANAPRPKRGTGKDIEDMDVENDDDLENYITAMRRKK